jgi:hypothetical protein
MFSLIKRMKGPHQMVSEPTKRADPLAEMKAAIDRSCAAAEDAGILPRDITPYVEGLLTYWRQRALHVADQANATRMHDRMGISLITPGTSHERGQYAKNRSAWPVNASGRNQSTAALKRKPNAMDSSDDWFCIVSVCNRCVRRVVSATL